MSLLKLSTARRISFKLLDPTDSINGKTGLTPTVQLSKNGGTYATAGGSVVEVSGGVYYLDANTTDTNTLGDLGLRVASTANNDPVDDFHQVVAELPGVLAASTIQSIWDALTSALTTSGSIGKLLVDKIDTVLSTFTTTLSTIASYIDTEVAAIKAKTDNLPASPANEATLTTIASYIDTEVAAIKAKTDNLPSDPADASDIAGAFSTVNSSLSTINSNVLTRLPTSSYTAPDNTSITAIKAKTDNLPSDPADASVIAGRFDTVDGSLANITGKTNGLPDDTALELTNIETAIAALGSGATGYARGVGITYTFPMYHSTSGAPTEGLDVVVEVSKDGGAVAGAAGGVVEIEGGLYKINFSNGEMDCKTLAVHATAPGARDLIFNIGTEE